ncbi:hypothetical protein GAX06_08680 [Campylobacter coli]|nr:hypothetical protein [Campylobacter coli]
MSQKYDILFFFCDILFFRRHKDCIDPNGILAPGRGGIWPKNLRDERFVNNKRDALRMKEGKEK